MAKLATSGLSLGAYSAARSCFSALFTSLARVSLGANRFVYHQGLIY